MRPSDYWHRQCNATYQTDPIGIALIEELGPETNHVGLGLPASRRHLARLAGIHRPGARPPPGGDPPQGDLRERGPALRLHHSLRGRHHADRRLHVRDRLLHPHRRAGARRRGARLRVALRARAHPHPGEPAHAVPRRRRAAQGVLAHAGSVRRAHGGRGRDEDAQARHRHLPDHRARHDRHRQGGGQPRLPLRRALPLRHRRRLERRGDGEPRHRVQDALQEDARAGAAP